MIAKRTTSYHSHVHEYKINEAVYGEERAGIAGHNNIKDVYYNTWVYIV